MSIINNQRIFMPLVVSHHNRDIDQIVGNYTIIKMFIIFIMAIIPPFVFNGVKSITTHPMIKLIAILF